MARIIHISALTLIGAGWLGIAGCSSSNDPVGPGTTTGGTTTTTGGTSTTTGGTTGTTGGTSTTTGGTSTGTTGGTSTGTTGGTATGDMFSPLCAAFTTAAGPAPTKGGACVAADTQLCYKTCGPQSVGFKSETCSSGAYVEQSGCSFRADLDASCYKIPTTIDPSCPTTAPKSGDPCTVAVCTPCADAAMTYLDSSGAPKVGFCVCPAPGASGTSKWSCASLTAWPCPQGMGC